MKYKVSILRSPFRHPELARIKLKDNTLTLSDLQRCVENTNYLIKHKLHVPGYRLTHFGADGDLKGKSLGWVENLEVQNGRAVSDTDFTEDGKRLIRGKTVRYISSGIRTDFLLTGEPDGPILPGPYIHHVAMLGDEAAAQKDLTDLTTLELSEVKRKGVEMFGITETEGEVAYFTEIRQIRKEMKMATEDDDKPTQVVPITLFNEERTRNTTLQTENTTLKAENETLKTKIKDLESKEQTTRFAEYQATVKDKVEKAQKIAKFGADMSKSYVRMGEMAFGDPKREAAFAELVDGLAKTPSKLSARVDLREEENLDGDEHQNDDENRSTVEFAEDGSDLSEQDLATVGGDPVMAQRVSHVLKFRQVKDKKFGFSQLRDEIRRRRRR